MDDDRKSMHRNCFWGGSDQLLAHHSAPIRGNSFAEIEFRRTRFHLGLSDYPVNQISAAIVCFNGVRNVRSDLRPNGGSNMSAGNRSLNRLVYFFQ